MIDTHNYELFIYPLFLKALSKDILMAKAKYPGSLSFLRTSATFG